MIVLWREFGGLLIDAANGMLEALGGDRPPQGVWFFFLRGDRDVRVFDHVGVEQKVRVHV